MLELRVGISESKSKVHVSNHQTHIFGRKIITFTSNLSRINIFSQLGDIWHARKRSFVPDFENSCDNGPHRSGWSPLLSFGISMPDTACPLRKRSKCQSKLWIYEILGPKHYPSTPSMICRRTVIVGSRTSGLYKARTGELRCHNYFQNQVRDSAFSRILEVIFLRAEKRY